MAGKKVKGFKCPFEPLGKNVAVLVDEPAQVSSVIEMPDSATYDAREGEVMAVGPEIDQLKPGERVHFGAYPGSKIIVKLDGKKRKMLLIPIDKILAKVLDGGKGRNWLI